MDSFASVANYIGKTGYVVFNGMTINVQIFDAKMAYGQLRFKVKPVSGSGFSWMNQSSVQSITDASGKLVS